MQYLRQQSLKQPNAKEVDSGIQISEEEVKKDNS